MFIRKNLLAYADGKRNIFEICNILKTPLRKIIDQYIVLKKNKLLN